MKFILHKKDFGINDIIFDTDESDPLEQHGHVLLRIPCTFNCDSLEVIVNPIKSIEEQRKDILMEHVDECFARYKEQITPSDMVFAVEAALKEIKKRGLDL